MAIIEDGGGWNENISELQSAVIGLGGSVPLNGVLSNTEILTLQAEVNRLGVLAGLGTLIPDPDGDLANTTILELQHAVNLLLDGGITPIDPGPPWVELDMRSIVTGTIDPGANAVIRVAVGGAESAGGAFDVAFGAPISASITVTTGDDETDVQTAMDGICAGAVVTVESGTGGIGGAGLLNLLIEFAGDGAGQSISATVENDTILPGPPDNRGVAQTAVVGGARLVVWPDLQGHVDGHAGFYYDPDVPERGFVISSDANGSVLSQTYDGDQITTVPVDLSQFPTGFTIVHHMKVSGTPPDATSMITGDIAAYGDYKYMTVYDDAPESSFVVTGSSSDPASYGVAPGDNILWSLVYSVAAGTVMQHIDGPVLEPQTLYREGVDVASLLSQYGLSIGNYYSGGGYGFEGDERKWLLFGKPLLPAELLFVRLAEQATNEGTAYAFTLRNVIPPPPGPATIAGTITAGGAPAEGVVVQSYQGPTLTGQSNATGPDGTYEISIDALSGVPGDHDVLAVTPDAEHASTWYDGVLDQGDATPVAVTNDHTTPGIDIELLASPPQNLVALAGDGTVALMWDPVLGATYTVYRGAVPGGGAAIVAGLADPEYEDTTAVNDAVYYYRVTAVTGGGETLPSNEVLATPLDPATFDVASEVTDLVIWQDSADTATIHDTGGLTDTWDDKGPDGHDYVTISTNGPRTGAETVNGHNALRFDKNAAGAGGGGNHMQGDDPPDLPIEWSAIVIAGLDYAGTPIHPLLVAEDRRFHILSGQAAWANGPFFFNNQFGQTPIADTNAHIVAFKHDDNTEVTHVYLDAVLDSVGDGPGGTYGDHTQITKMGKNDGGSKADLLMCERITSSVWPTAIVESRVNTYLRLKWRTGTPVTLTAVSGNATVGLSWTEQPGATYNVYRGTVSGSLALLAADVAATTYDDDTATNDDEFFYAVAWVRGTYEGPLSAEAIGTPVDPDTFDVLTIPDLAQWVNARDTGTVHKTGTDIDAWDDGSGNGLDYTQAGAPRPVDNGRTINGHPAVEFQGTDYMVSALPARPSAEAIFAVAEFDQTVAAVTMFGDPGDGNQGCRNFSQAGTVTHMAYGTLSAFGPNGPTVAAGTPYVVDYSLVNAVGMLTLGVLGFDGVQHEVREGSQTGWTGDDNNTAMGCASTPGTPVGFFDGLMGEAIVTHSDPGDVWRSRIRTYLRLAWEA